MHHIEVSTIEERQSDQFEYWKLLVQYHYNAIPLPGSNAMNASISSYMVGNIVMSLSSYDAHQGSRTRSQINRHLRSQYCIQLVINGQITGKLGATEVILLPGDIYVTDLLQESIMEGSKGSTLTVVVDHQTFHSVAGEGNFHGAFLSSGTPKAVILTALLQEVHLALVKGPISDIESLQSAIVSMIGCCFSASRRSRTCEDNEVKQKIVNFVKENISDASLSVGKIASELNVSRASIYRAFQNDGGISRYVADQRLNRALRQLKSVPRQKSLSAVARLNGFKNAFQFVTVFRSKFGINPDRVTADMEIDCGLANDASDHHFMKKNYVKMLREN